MRDDGSADRMRKIPGPYWFFPPSSHHLISEDNIRSPELRGRDPVTERKDVPDERCRNDAAVEITEVETQEGFLAAPDDETCSGIAVKGDIELTVPENCPESVQIARCLHDEYDTDDLAGAFGESVLRTIELQSPCKIEREMSLPAGRPRTLAR